MQKLTIDPTFHTARTIAAMLKHDLGFEGPKASECAMNLAKLLDRRPEEMFDMTYNELFEAVVEYKALRVTPPIIVTERPR